MKTTRKLLIPAGVLLCALLVFPPWLYTYDRNGNNGGHSRMVAGHFPIFDPPPPNAFTGEPQYHGVRLDGSRLLVEVIAVLGVTVVAAFIFRLKPTP